MLTERNKIFPYKTLDFFKKNSFDKFFDYNNNNSDREIIFKGYHTKYPNFLDKKINLTKYHNRVNIWIDRIYYNHKNDEKLLDSYLINIQRHRKLDIAIEIQENVIIYRPICELNDNSIYNDWEKADFEIAIVGLSCVHNKIVKKKFNKGSFYLNSGGPISSDPIFIKNLTDINSVTVK